MLIIKYFNIHFQNKSFKPFNITVYILNIIIAIVIFSMMLFILLFLGAI